MYVFIYFIFFQAAVKPLQTSNASTGAAWYKSSSAISKPTSQSYIVKTSTRDSSDDWDSPGEESPSGDNFVTSDGLKMAEQGPAEMEPVPEKPVDFEMLPLLRPSGDKVYRRPAKNKEQLDSGGTPETSAGGGASKPTAGPGRSGSGVAGSSEVKATTGRGRVRDYTVLHPSCVSVCNVTIQDSLDRSMDEFVNTAPADLGEAGTFRRKTDTQAAKPTR